MTGAVKNGLNPRTARILLALILLAALVLRLAAIFVPMFGDESMTTIANITKFFRDRTILPEDVIYPTLFSYLEAFVLGAWSLILLLLGKAHTFAGVGLLFITDQAPLFPPLRMLTVLFDLGSVVAAYLLGRKLRGARAGLIAALFVCLSSNHLHYARWALPDVPMAFFATVSLIFALKIVSEPKLKWYVWSGLLAGLAISTKYNAGTIVVGIIAAHFLARREDARPFQWAELKKLVFAGLVCAGAFFAGSPVWLIQPMKTISVFRETVAHMTGGHNFVPGGPPYVWIAGYLWQSETTIGVIAIAGLIWAIARRRREEAVLVVPILVSMAIIGAWQKQSPYYLLVIWTALLTLGAVFIDDVAGLMRRPNVVAATIAIVVGIIPMRSALVFARDGLREDNRAAATQWIQQNIPAGARIGVDWGYMPELWDSDYMAEAEKRRREQFNNGPDYQIWQRFAEKTRAYHLVPIQYDPGWLKDAGLDYLITSNMCYDRFMWGKVPPEGHPFRDEYLKRREFYTWLHSENPLMRLAHEEVRGSGPTVEIYLNRATEEAFHR